MYPELIPPTIENRQFPGGDILEIALQRAGKLNQELFAADTDKQFSMADRLIKKGKDRLGISPSDAGIYEQVLALGQAWGNTLERERLGFEPDGAGSNFGKKLTSAMLAMQGYLSESLEPIPTKYTSDFAEDLAEMSGKDAFAIKTFADGVWPGMHRSYPRLYSVLAPFQAHYAGLIFNDLAELKKEDIEDNPYLYGLEAAMAVPYVLSSATRMDRYFPNDSDERFNSTLARLGLQKVYGEEEPI
jgi:hypothetical protein